MSKAENLLSQMSVSMRLTSRENQVLYQFINVREFSVSNVVKFLNVSRQQVNNIIRGLIEKGRINKIFSFTNFSHLANSEKSDYVILYNVKRREIIELCV